MPDPWLIRGDFDVDYRSQTPSGETGPECHNQLSLGRRSRCLDPRSSSIGVRRTKRLSPKSPSFPAARRWRDLQGSSCRHRNHHSGMDRNCQGTPPSHPRVAGPLSPERFSRTVPSTCQRKKQSQKPHGSAPLTTSCIRPTCVAPVRARRRFVPKRQLLAGRRRKSWVRYGPNPPTTMQNGDSACKTELGESRTCSTGAGPRKQRRAFESPQARYLFPYSSNLIVRLIVRFVET